MLVPAAMSIFISQPRGQATPSGTTLHSGDGTASFIPFGSTVTFTSGIFEELDSSASYLSIKRERSLEDSCLLFSGEFFNLSMASLSLFLL